jgi:hypothetical protein
MTLAEFLLARIAEDEAQGGCGGPDRACAQLADRVLAECEAKQRIVERHAPDSIGDGSSLHVCHDSLADDTDCVELRALALPYADHPDYRQEWRL